MYNTNNGMYANYEVETNKETTTTNKTKESQSMMMESGMNMGYGMGYSNAGMMCPPIYECPQERVIHRQYIHNVPHVCPINTRIVNHHVYKHTYSPCYTCCEENEVCNVTEGCCNNF